MPVIVSNTKEVMQKQKCDLEAMFYIREAENEASYEEKLFKLNQAMCFAKSTDILVEILKKRVDIYASLKLYQQCNENEVWLQNFLNPEEPKNLLYLKNCYFNCSNIMDTIAISADVLTAQTDIKSGRLIAKEDPFCGILLENAVYRRCKNCLKCNKLNLIPCIKCHSAMFCSIKCHDDAQFHHKFECQVPQIVAKLPFHFRGIIVGIRSLSELLIFFKGCVDQLMDFVDYYVNHPKQFCEIDYKNLIGVQKYAAMLQLKHFSTKDCYDELVETIDSVLNMYNSLKDLFVTSEQKRFLKDFLVMQSTLDYVVHYDYKLDQPMALSVNFIYNLMQHSCTSNVHAILDDGIMYYYTKYPVKKNSQLTYNHILSFESFNYDIRKSTAKKSDVDCKCQACLENYPTLYKMPVYDLKILEMALHQQDDVHIMKEKELKHMLKKNCEYIDANYSKKFPSQEIFILNSCNVLILSNLITKEFE